MAVLLTMSASPNCLTTIRRTMKTVATGDSARRLISPALRTSFSSATSRESPMPWSLASPRGKRLTTPMSQHKAHRCPMGGRRSHTAENREEPKDHGKPILHATQTPGRVTISTEGLMRLPRRSIQSSAFRLTTRMTLMRTLIAPWPRLSPQANSS